MIICIPKLEYKLLRTVFYYKLTIVSSQPQHSNSNGYFVLKNGFKHWFLIHKYKSDSDLVWRQNYKICIHQFWYKKDISFKTVELMKVTQWNVQFIKDYFHFRYVKKKYCTWAHVVRIRTQGLNILYLNMFKKLGISLVNIMYDCKSLHLIPQLYLYLDIYLLGSHTEKDERHTVGA